MNALREHLGVHFEQLPPLLQRAHQGAIRLTGSVAVVRGSGLAWLLGKLLGMPEAGTTVPLVVKGQHSAEVMIWQRDFAGLRLISHFRRIGDYLLEKIGPITLWMRLRVEPGRLVYRLEQVSLFGFTLPQTLTPQLVAFEAEADQRYLFKVEVRLPLLGLLVGYSGYLDLHSDAELVSCVPLKQA